MKAGHRRQQAGCYQRRGPFVFHAGVRRAAPLMIRKALVVTVSAMATIDQRASVLTGFDDNRSCFPHTSNRAAKVTI
jgi:hypothetical protein